MDITMKELLKKPNVVAVGKGHKIVHGVDTGKDAIVVCVTKKVTPREKAIAMLGKSSLIPEYFRGVATDVIETGEIRALRTTKHRPAPGGVSIGHPDVTAGTLGMIVKKDGERHILSNNHVMANSNDANIGDAIYQPGVYDGGKEEDTIAHLTSFVPIEFSGVSDCPLARIVVNGCNRFAKLFGRRTRLEATFQGINTVDCAIARPIDDSLVYDEILEIGVPVGTAQVNIGTPIKKSGRTTGLTQGTVAVIDATATVNYGIGIAIFEDQIITSNISAGGDSGSAVLLDGDAGAVILNENNEVIGLLFAGSDTVTIVNKIGNVISALGLDGM